MGFLGKLSKKDNSNTPMNDKSENKGSAGIKNNKKNDLERDLNESVWEHVHEEFKANKQFVRTDEQEGTVQYVALIFDTRTIGGLAGKTARKDESKGSILEDIRVGHIKTYVLPDMLQDESFIIIPDKDTLDDMAQYNFLVNAKYTLCTVTPDGMIKSVSDKDGQDCEVTYKQVADLVKDGGDVKSLFPENKSEVPDVFNGKEDDKEDDKKLEENDPNNGSDNKADSKTDDKKQSAQPSSDGSDGENIDNFPDAHEESPDDYDAVNKAINLQDPSGKPQADAGNDDFGNNSSDGDGDAIVIKGSDNDNKDGVPPVNDIPPDLNMPDDSDDDNYEDEYDPFDRDTIEDIVTRKFYSDDLGIEISTKPFDARFMHGNPYIPFDENRGDSWLDKQLSNMAKDGNVRMQRLHSENLYKLREQYMSIMQDSCEEIVKSVSVSNDETEFGKIKAIIEGNRSSAIESLDNNVSDKIQKAEQQWQDTLKIIGERAASEAIAAHELSFGPQHKHDIQKIKSYARDDIDRVYRNDIKRLNEDRRATATKQLDLAINRTLDELSKSYLNVLQKERKEYVRLQNEMTKFADENRKNELARIEVLAEENRLNNKAEEIRTEYASTIKAMAAEFESRESQLREDINTLRFERENELKRTVSSWSKQVDNEKAKTNDVQEKFNDLLDKYKDLSENKDVEYADRMQHLKEENNSYKDELEHMASVHKRSNRIAILFVVAAVIAAIGAGFMLGSLLNIRRTSQAEQDAISKVQQDISVSVSDSQSSLLISENSVVSDVSNETIQESEFSINTESSSESTAVSSESESSVNESSVSVSASESSTSVSTVSHQSAVSGTSDTSVPRS